MLLSLHLAVSYDKVKAHPVVRSIKTNQGIEKRENFNTIAFLTDFSDRAENHLGDIRFTKSTPKFLGGSILFCLLLVAYIVTAKRKMINGKEYGTAEWATIKSISNLFAINIEKGEIKKIKNNYLENLEIQEIKLEIKEIKKDKELSAKDKEFSIEQKRENIVAIKAKVLSAEQKREKIAAIMEKYKDADMLFTKSERICMRNHELNNNTTIFGGSGSGKTRGFVLPNVLQAHSSYVITDPKGEILEKLGYFLEHKKGYKIRVLNLDEKTLSSGYNPLRYVHRERDGWEEKVLTLIETIIINTDGGEKKSGTDPFWDKAERLFLQSVFFATVEAFPPEQANMNTVIELIRWLTIEEESDNHDSDLDIFFQCFEQKYGADHIAVDQFKEFRSKASGKTAKSIVISAVARLAPFKVKELKRIFSYDDMHLEMVGEEKTAVFVIMPPVDTTYNFIAGILFTQLFQELNYCALNVHKQDGQTLPVPCRFILDEFANTCTIPNFVRIQSYARSLGIGIVIILQSLEQIKNMYKDEWGVIIDNSNTMLYLGRVTHVETLEYLTKLLGKGTFDKRSTSRTKGRQSSTSTNNDRLGRDLLDPSEIRKIKNDRCLFFVGGQNPFYSRKYNYKQHKNYKLTSDGNKQFSYIYKPTPPPVFMEPVPHGEENVVDLEPLQLTYKDIQAEFGQESVSEYLSSHILNSDFDLDDVMIVNDGECEELALFAELEREESNIKDTMDAILAKVIEFKTDPISLVKTGVELLKAEVEDPDSVNFDDVEVNDGEPSVVDEYVFDEEEEEGALSLALANAENLLIDMTEEMNGFMEQLVKIDGSGLN